MQATTQINRQGRGCGFEPAPPPGVAVVPWQPPLSSKGYRHRPLPVICAGYTTRLPEVDEVIRAHAHWSKGQLATFLGGEEATDTLLAYIEILDSELSAMQTWGITSINDGGGRE